MTPIRSALSALTVLTLASVAVSGCTSAILGSDHQTRSASRQPALSGPTPAAPSSSARVTPPAKRSVPKSGHPVVTTAVHMGLFEGDDLTYGVGMPVIVRFTHRVTDTAAFEKAATVLLDGRPAHGAWAWESSKAPGFVMEAHYRQPQFWPAHSHISVNLPMAGLSAGKGLSYGNTLTLSMNIGAAHITTVDASNTAPSMTVTSDAKFVRKVPVSLGDAQNPTYRGTKVIEEFDAEQNMGSAIVPWSLRITTSGEFVHSASWNNYIGRANLSHGCTNLSTADAKWFYKFSMLGDVLQYGNAPGKLMNPVDGIGDWNVPWAQWTSGALLG